MWTDASSVLYQATGNRAYYKKITILVPKTWKSETYAGAKTETYDKVRVLRFQKFT